jgi:hypothetical protein
MTRRQTWPLLWWGGIPFGGLTPTGRRVAWVRFARALRRRSRGDEEQTQAPRHPLRDPLHVIGITPPGAR